MNDWALYAKAYTGGLLIGLAATLLLLLIGRIAGISGIVAGATDLHSRDTAERQWRWLFILGMIAAALLWQWRFGALTVEINVGIPLLVTAGLLVGLGTRLGSGCTSGHGVCGIGRRSLRSITATIVFILFGVATVTTLRAMGVVL